jgi:glycosyltransferase involved in cell wall biosynthesis
VSRRSILLVEDQAHVEHGHFPHSCVSLARALTALGCDVRLLTTRGLVRSPGESDGFAVEHFGAVTGALWSLAAALAPSPVRTEWTRRSRWSAHAAATVRAAAVGLATRRAARRCAESVPEVILFGYDVHTFVLAGLVGRGRFVHHVFRPPPADRPITVAGRALDGWARRCERDRRRNLGGFRVAAATPALVDAWTRRAPFLDPVLIAHAMSRTESPVDDARRALGIKEGVRVALVFGADHGNKDLDTVWRAFTELPEWTLLVVGRVADSFHAYAAAHAAPDAIVVGGYVDDTTRARAYSAADVVVVSFEAKHRRDSGVLQDALAFARPVVVSDGSDAADKVAGFGLGAVFEAENPAALAAAVRAAPSAVAPEAVERALASTSDRAVARAHLDAFDALAHPEGGQTGRK